MKKGLVMEGGAQRGMFTSGITDVLAERGVTFDGAIGVSAGAAFGCNVKSGQNGRVIRYNKRFCKDWRFCSLRSLILTGDIYGAKFCYETIPFKLDPFDVDAYRKNPMEFWMVVTDIDTAETVFYNSKSCDREDLRWMRASASMPLASRPVKIGGRRYMDGAISNSIPLKEFEKMGYKKNVVILTRPEEFVKEPFKLSGLLKVRHPFTPALREAMERRHLVYQQQTGYVKEAEDRGDAFVFRPPEEVGINTICHDPEVLEHAYRMGRELAEKRFDELEAFLG